MAVDLKNTKSLKNLQGIAKKSVEEAGNKIVKDIPLSEIDFHPYETEIYLLRDIDALAASIERNGFIGAIDVYQKPDGRYQISSGHRRYEAMKALGRKTIPCLIYPMESEIEVNKKLIESNINGRNASPLELSNSIVFYENLLLESGFKGSINDQLSTVFNMSTTKIAQLKAINKFSEEIKKMAQAEKFPYEAFYAAASFKKENQKQLFDMISDYLEKYSEGELTALVVTQFINKIKTDIKREKEEKERQEILNTQRTEPQISNQNEALPDKADTSEMAKRDSDIAEEMAQTAEKVSPVTPVSAMDDEYFNNIQEVASPVQTDGNAIVSTTYEHVDKATPKQVEADSKKEIDFDLQLYVNHIKNAFGEGE